MFRSFVAMGVKSEAVCKAQILYLMLNIHEYNSVLTRITDEEKNSNSFKNKFSNIKKETGIRECHGKLF